MVMHAGSVGSFLNSLTIDDSAYRAAIQGLNGAKPDPMQFEFSSLVFNKPCKNNASKGSDRLYRTTV
jgi:hypothetical protein